MVSCNGMAWHGVAPKENEEDRDEDDDYGDRGERQTHGIME
jgi:hypothetical protein